MEGNQKAGIDMVSEIKTMLFEQIKMINAEIKNQQPEDLLCLVQAQKIMIDALNCI